MFKLTRRTLAGLTAVAALAGGIGTGAATPPVADAQLTINPGGAPPQLGAFQEARTAPAPGCKKWRVPHEFEIKQSNRWKVVSVSRRALYTWSVAATADPREADWMGGTMKLSRFDTSGRNPQVRFTITWKNGSAGIYTGVIDRDGFLSGTSRDKFNPNSKARFDFAETIDCARW